MVETALCHGYGCICVAGGASMHRLKVICCRVGPRSKVHTCLLKAFYVFSGTGDRSIPPHLVGSHRPDCRVNPCCSMRFTYLQGLLLWLPCAYPFLLKTPGAPILSSRRRVGDKKVEVRMSNQPASEGSVDAQAMEIIAELNAGTKSM